MYIRILLSSLIILFLSGLNYAQKLEVAKVSALGGQAAEIKEKETGKIRQLKLNDKIYEGDQVRCQRKCTKLVIVRCKTYTKEIKKKGWRSVPATNCSGRKDIRRAGGPKTNGTIFISPVEGQVILPDNFVLRWKQTSKPKKFKLLLKIYFDDDLWFKTGINGQEGYFKSDCLIEELKEARLNNELILQIKLIDDEDQNKSQSIIFKLLSIQKQKDLEQKLSIFDEESDMILKAVGRSSIYDKFKLYEEAVREVEEALRIAKSKKVNTSLITEVTSLAIETNYKFYKDERVKELCETLVESERSEICKIVAK